MGGEEEWCLVAHVRKRQRIYSRVTVRTEFERDCTHILCVLSCFSFYHPLTHPLSLSIIHSPTHSLSLSSTNPPTLSHTRMHTHTHLGQVTVDVIGNVACAIHHFVCKRRRRISRHCAKPKGYHIMSAMCVYICICKYLCIVCMYICTCVRVYVCIYVCMCV